MATLFSPDPAEFRSLQDKVVVLTGGASGIGAGNVEVFYEHGANVVFGDINAAAGEELAARFDSRRVKFLKVDVISYDDNLALFKLALAEYGRVDHAIPIAGIVDRGNMFEPGLSIESVEKPHALTVLDVNLKAVVNFTRVATAYLAHNAQPSDLKSITLLSSIEGLQDTSAIPTYCAAKHGVVGLLRSLRDYHPHTFSIRINAVCPFLTETPMISPFREGIREQDIPLSATRDVANAIRALAVGFSKDKKAFNGLAVVTVGKMAFEVEEGLTKSRDVWLGETVTDAMKRLRQAFPTGYWHDKNKA